MLAALNRRAPLARARRSWLVLRRRGEGSQSPGAHASNEPFLFEG